MPFVGGNNARVLLHSKDLSAFSNNATVSGSFDTADVTVYGDGDREFLKTLRSYQATVSGFLDAAATGNGSSLSDLFTDTAVRAFTIAPAGDSVGSICYTGHVWGPSLELGAPVDGMQTFAISAASSAKFGEKQGFGAGLMLHELKAETAPGNYADNDNTTSSSNGYVGVLHCTAFTSGSTTVKLQHGVTVGTYADLGTQFTALTATGSQVVYGTGTVNRFVRAITSAVSASTTFAVAFVRK